MPERGACYQADGMRILFDAAIPTQDGSAVFADVYLPLQPGAYPALVSYGPYGKNMPFDQGYSGFFAVIDAVDPAWRDGTSGKYMAWEQPDPEKWVTEGYAIVRVDARGTGRTPGVVENFSEHERQDFYDAIEWVAAQQWCTGKVGTTGSSYLGMMQWFVATLAPPSLAAMYVSEAAADYYREIAHHGGILNEFTRHWFSTQFATNQHGLGERGWHNKHTGVSGTGTITLSDQQLAANVGLDLFQAAAHRPFDDDEFYRVRRAAFEQIRVPFVSVGSWGAQGIHLRGNIEGFLNAASEQKWLHVTSGSGFVFFHSEAGRAHQLRFFDYFLKDKGDWNTEPPVRYDLRLPDGTSEPRSARQFPPENTEWTALHLDTATMTMSVQPPSTTAKGTYEAFSAGLTFRLEPQERDLEIAGPLALTIDVSSTTTDADLFAVLRLFGPDGSEVLYRGQPDPKSPPGLGWLRASHRAVDPERSRPWQPFHPHLGAEPLVPGEVYTVAIEIWPTCLLVPAGHSLAVTISGRDFDHGQEPVDLAYAGSSIRMRGVGNFNHADPGDRPPEIFSNRITIHTGGGRPATLLVPFTTSTDQNRSRSKSARVAGEGSVGSSRKAVVQPR
jgi:uncharacterized protein